MKVAINVEFTDDELRKYAEDVGRRWTMCFFQEAFKTGQRLKLNPNALSAIGLALASALSASGVKTHSAPRPDPGPTADTPIPYAPTPSRCERVEVSPFNEEGWMCHPCGFYNGVQRAVCRHCDHERCDIVVPPPPHQDDPSVQ